MKFEVEISGTVEDNIRKHFAEKTIDLTLEAFISHAIAHYTEKVFTTVQLFPEADPSTPKIDLKYKENSTEQSDNIFVKQLD